MSQLQATRNELITVCESASAKWKWLYAIAHSL